MLGYFKFNTIHEGIVSILSTIDTGIYQLVATMLDGLYNIADTTMNIGFFEEIFERLYVLLAIFTLFKLAFSVLSGIINPDSFSDKKNTNGFQKIITRIVIVMALLLITPDLFDFAYRVQGHVVQVIPQFILGPNKNYRESSAGEETAKTILKSFLRENPECGIEVEDIDEMEKFSEVASLRCPTNNQDGKKIFKYVYTMIISTVIGLLMVFLLILCSIDVAMRLIKLTILQIIAPIPIISYVDPKSEKDGSFSKWSKECIATYISLFIQLTVIYIVIYMISDLSAAILSNEASSIINFPVENTGARVWIFIFIVLGGFFFMKQAPKYILNILGLKSGAGLGIGMAAGMAGLGALTMGGGLKAFGAAFGGSLSEGAAANADGKSAFSAAGFSKGREIAQRVKTGDPKAKAPTIGGQVKSSINRVKAARAGFSTQTIEEAKNAKFAAADAAANAASMRTRLENSNYDIASSWSQDEQNSFNDYVQRKGLSYNNSQELAAIVDSYVNEKNTLSNKASKYYDDAKSYANSLGVDTDERLEDKFSKKYKAKTNTKYDKWAQNAIAKNKANNVNNAFDPNKFKS